MLDLEGCTPGPKLQQDISAIGEVLLAQQRQEDLVPEREHPGLNTVILTTQRSSPSEIRPRTRTRPQTESQSIASRCAPCRFAGVPKVPTFLTVNPGRRSMLIWLQSKCDGTVGSVCTRCQHLKSRVAEETRRRARKWLDRTDDASCHLPQFLLEPSESLSLPKVLFFELGIVSPPLS